MIRHPGSLLVNPSAHATGRNNAGLAFLSLSDSHFDLQILVLCTVLRTQTWNLAVGNKDRYSCCTLQTTPHNTVKQDDIVRDEPQMTRWSLVARAQDLDDAARTTALNTLLETYLPVLKWYLTRHSGLDAHKREDLIQGFVAKKILDQSILMKADRSRGRFRSFLLGAFQNYIRDELRRGGHGGHLLPLEEADGVSADDADMERELRQAWVRHVVAQATESMQSECTTQNRGDVWAIFESRLLAPMIDGEKPESYDVLVARLGLQSPSQASNLLVTAKRMFARHLHSVVAETVASPDQVEEELQELKMCL